MNITIIAVGKIKEKYLQDGINEYVKRLTRFAKLNIIEVKDESIPANASDLQKGIIKETEGKRIISKIKRSSVLIAADIRGEEITTEKFASAISDYAVSGRSDLTFIIGGSLGLSALVADKADMLLSFSHFTFPHQLFRLILLEQIYRCFKIINNETYHK